MKEEYIINKMRHFKMINASDDDINKIYSNIAKEIKINAPKTTKRMSFVKIASISVLFILVILFLSTTFTNRSMGIQVAYYQARIMITNNQDQKANISIQMLKNGLEAFNSEANSTNLSRLSYTMDNAQANVSKLDLNGNPGEYSSDDCENTLKSYKYELIQIQFTLNRIPHSTRNQNLIEKINQLSTKAGQIENSVNTSLSFYKSKV